MRLSAEQRQAIHRLSRELLGERVRVQLFGSRLNDAAHGGDVDLLLQAETPVSMAQQADLGWQLEEALGLPVDIVVIDHQGPCTAFQQLALARARDIPPDQGTIE
jgi:predicted nucleotidyltransferase